MKDPSRLLDSKVESFEAELLRAGRQDQAPPGARQRTLLSLGVVASGVGTGLTATTTASATAGAAANAGTGVAAGLVGKAAGSLGGAMIAKWVVITAVGGTLTVAASRPLWAPAQRAMSSGVAPRNDREMPGLIASGSSVSLPVTAASAPSTSSVPADARVEPLAELASAAEQSAAIPSVLLSSPSSPRKKVARQDTPSSAPKVVEEERPAQAATDESLAPPPPIPSSRVASPTSLTAEVTALETIRAAIRAKQGQAAITLLNEHRIRFPNAMLGIEAAVLRVDALLLTGNRSSAIALAERLLQQQPNGPYAARLRKLVSEPASNLP